MAIDSLQQLKTQFEKLQKQVNGQLLGNNMSSNYRPLLQRGGSAQGWFALTNNGVTTFINNATANPTGGAISTSVQSVDVASGDYATLGPFSLNFISNAINSTVAILGQNGGVGQLTLFPMTGNNSLIADGTGQMILTGNGVNRGSATLSGASIVLSRRLIAGSLTLSSTTITIADGIGDATTVTAVKVITGTLQPFPSLVSGLPASPGAGTIASVSNALAPSLGAVVTGGGAAFALVWYNGTNWTVIGV